MTASTKPPQQKLTFLPFTANNHPPKMSQFSKVPPQALKQPEPFSLHVSDEDVEEFKSLLNLSKIGPVTWENSREGFGVTREWLSDTKDFWLQQFDWRHQEKLINSFPNFKATVTDPVHDSLSIHFVALFSNKPDAIPIVFLHGWPGMLIKPRYELHHGRLTNQVCFQGLSSNSFRCWNFLLNDMILRACPTISLSRPFLDILFRQVPLLIGILVTRMLLEL